MIVRNFLLNIVLISMLCGCAGGAKSEGEVDRELVVDRVANPDARRGERILRGDAPDG